LKPRSRLPNSASVRIAGDDLCYDPLEAPDPEEWLELDEHERKIGGGRSDGDKR